jgi:hypothetical protein
MEISSAFGKLSFTFLLESSYIYKIEFPASHNSLVGKSQSEFTLLHKLTMSSTASVHDAKSIPPAELVQPIEAVNEYEDAEKNFQPKTLRFWTIIIGMYMSIFLIALVSFAVQLHTYTSDLHSNRIEL